MTSPPKPVSFTTEQVTKQKLNDLSNNVQWLVDNNVRTRYSVGGITRDTGIKILAGKTAISKQPARNYGYSTIYFGNFFTSGCKPIVSTSVESIASNMHRSKVVIQALTGASGGIDHTGFSAILTGDAYKRLDSAVWIHWIAIGW